MNLSNGFATLTKRRPRTDKEATRTSGGGHTSLLSHTSMHLDRLGSARVWLLSSPAVALEWLRWVESGRSAFLSPLPFFTGEGWVRVLLVPGRKRPSTKKKDPHRHRLGSKLPSLRSLCREDGTRQVKRPPLLVSARSAFSPRTGWETSRLYEFICTPGTTTISDIRTGHFR
jgi:hypothetical protein